MKTPKRESVAKYIVRIVGILNIFVSVAGLILASEAVIDDIERHGNILELYSGAGFVMLGISITLTALLGIAGVLMIRGVRMGTWLALIVYGAEVLYFFGMATMPLGAYAFTSGNMALYPALSTWFNFWAGLLILVGLRLGVRRQKDKEPAKAKA